MKKYLFVFLAAVVVISCSTTPRTRVTIDREKFLVNGKPTYKGRTWRGYEIEGLLFNSRMVQGIFDDLNPETRTKWKYPDTGEWDPDRNTREFVGSMEEWKNHGVLAFTLNLQGGSPMGYGNQGWVNSALDEKGDLRPAYMDRLELILDKADELGMVVILGIYYFGQDQYLLDEKAVINGVDRTVDWLFSKGYRNILIEINNECDVDAYDHDILKPGRVHELIRRVKSDRRDGYHYPVSTSFMGNAIPDPAVVEASDFILMHGNGVSEPSRISEMVALTRDLDTYRPMPILFNEDDHYRFGEDSCNLVAAVRSYASWGFFDFRRDGESFEEGYQSVPVDWRISSDRKRAFFNKVKEITGY